MQALKRYAKNVLIGIDQLANTVFGGSPDETISSRLWRYRSNPVAAFWVKFLDLLQKDHCKNSLEPEEHHEEDVLK